jgi:hypothetical protein
MQRFFCDIHFLPRSVHVWGYPAACVSMGLYKEQETSCIDASMQRFFCDILVLRRSVDVWGYPAACVSMFIFLIIWLISTKRGTTTEPSENTPKTYFLSFYIW